MELLVNGSLVATDHSSPFSFTMAATAPTFTVNGWNVITAIATDNNSNLGRSDTLKVYVTGNNLLTRRLTENEADAETAKFLEEGLCFVRREIN